MGISNLRLCYLKKLSTASNMSGPVVLEVIFTQSSSSFQDCLKGI